MLLKAFTSRAPDSNCAVNSLVVTVSVSSSAILPSRDG